MGVYRWWEKEEARNLRRTLWLGWVGLSSLPLHSPKGHKHYLILTPTCACGREGSSDGRVLADRPS